MSAERKPRVPAAQAKAVLMEATISLLREIPVVELSTRKIEERAGLDRRAITRQFGGELGLFIATLEELNRRSLERSKSLPADNSNFMNEELKMRVDLLAFLILSGVATERLKEMHPSPEIVQEFMQRFGMDSDTPPVIREALLALLQAIVLSRSFFGPTSTRNTPENAVVIFKMVRYLGSIAPDLPALLGIEEG
jgi:AcrR family transcriptional regulator